MTPAKAWKTLGIERTADRRSIKRAYAAKLKAIDPDKDAAAFLELRNALESAIQQAEWDAEEARQRENQIEFEDQSLSGQLEVSENGDAHFATPSDEAEAEAGPAATSWDDDPRSPLAALLWDKEPGGDHVVRVGAAIEELLQSPRMLDIDFARETEDWLCWILTETIPNSDPAIIYADRYFRWEQAAERVGAPWQVGFLSARAEDLGVIQRLENPDHRWHEAWTVLKPGSMKPGYATRTRMKGNVLALLDSLRTHNPALETILDREQVEYWDKKRPKIERGESDNRWVLSLAAIFMVIVVRFIGGDNLTAPPTPYIVSSDLQRSPNYQQWRSEQAPNVQMWMDAHLSEVEQLFEHQATKGPGLPSCAALDATAPLSLSDYDICLEAEILRTQGEHADTQETVSVPQTTSGRLVYSSPLWRSEQAPRVQKWMDSQPEALDMLLQPHVKKGGLPTCSQLAVAASMTAGELAQCRRAEQARLATQSVKPSGKVDQAPSPKETRTVSDAPGRSVPPSCSDPMFANLELCKPKPQDVAIDPKREE